jgi:hypothetical protein
MDNAIPGYWLAWGTEPWSTIAAFGGQIPCHITNIVLGNVIAGKDVDNARPLFRGLCVDGDNLCVRMGGTEEDSMTLKRQFYVICVTPFAFE